MKQNESPVGQLLQKKVTRKEFLGIAGSAVVSILGFSTIIHFLTGKRVGIKHLSVSDHGFGSGFYGR